MAGESRLRVTSHDLGQTMPSGNFIEIQTLLWLQSHIELNSFTSCLRMFVHKHPSSSLTRSQDRKFSFLRFVAQTESSPLLFGKLPVSVSGVVSVLSMPRRIGTLEARGTMCLSL